MRSDLSINLIFLSALGFSDPFCVVKRDDKKLFSTSVKKKTLSPKWNETVTFQVTEDGGMLEIVSLHTYHK